MTIKSATRALVKRVPWESIPLYRKYSDVYRRARRRKLAIFIASGCAVAAVITSSILYLI